MQLTWSSDIETGNALIDSEHKILFEKVNNLMEACRVGAGREKVAETAGFLFTYTKTHFAHELDLCKKNGSFNYEAHKKFHDDFTVKINDLHATMRTQEPNIALVATINQTVASLVSHIRTMDKALAKHIQEQGK